MLRSLMSTPSSRIWPSWGSYHRSIKPTMVDFPEPLAPTMAVVFLASKSTVTSFRTFREGLAGYAKETLQRAIWPATAFGVLPLWLSGSMFGWRAMISNMLLAAAAAFVNSPSDGAIIVIAEVAIRTEKRTLML